MEDRSQPREQTIEEKSKNGSTVHTYKKGRYLGKGGFAKCYQFTELGSGRKFAAKIIQKASLTRSKAKEKLASQIEIHRSVRSQYVVKYEKNFQDGVNVYILLQLCPNQTLNELIKRRKRITQIEAKYYLRQIALAIKDFQQQMIIHRDLKLGNLLLTDTLEIRISDFGLAAKLNHPQERRKTMCGTPNYIAPEILENHTNQGHSYEVDIWSLGVIAYACMVGRPPFETNDVKTTYAKIKMCNYSFPDNLPLSTPAKHFISKLLQKDPKHRLTIQEILNDSFFAQPLPTTLPTTLLACPPNKQFLQKYSLTHLTSTDSQPKLAADSSRTLIRTNSNQQLNKNTYGQRAASTTALSRGRMLSEKRDLPKVPLTLGNSNLQQHQGPHVWVTFFEQNPKFGLAYLLNSNATGMRFNDSTSMISNSHFQKMKYIDSLGRPEAKEQIFQNGEVPNNLAKKFKIISYYQKQLRSKKDTYEANLTNQQIILRERHRFKESNEQTMQVWLNKHTKTSKATIFWFNNKDYQTVFQDYTELLSSKDQMTYVNKLGQRIQFHRDQIDNQAQEVKKRYKYMAGILQNMRETRNKERDNKENNRLSNNNKEAASKESYAEQIHKQPAMMRSSSTMRMQKSQTTGTVTLRGSASTSRIVHNPRIFKY